LPAEAENLPAVDVARECAFAYLANGARRVTRFRARDLDQDDWPAHMWAGAAEEHNGADLPVVDQVDPARDASCDRPVGAAGGVDPRDATEHRAVRLLGTADQFGQSEFLMLVVGHPNKFVLALDQPVIETELHVDLVVDCPAVTDDGQLRIGLVEVSLDPALESFPRSRPGSAHDPPQGTPCQATQISDLERLRPGTHGRRDLIRRCETDRADVSRMPSPAPSTRGPSVSTERGPMRRPSAHHHTAIIDRIEQRPPLGTASGLPATAGRRPARCLKGAQPRRRRRHAADLCTFAPRNTAPRDPWAR